VALDQCVPRVYGVKRRTQRLKDQVIMVKLRTRELNLEVFPWQGLKDETLGKIGSPRCRGTRPWCVFSFLAQQIRKMASMEEDGWSVAMARLYPLQQFKRLERKNRVLLRQGSISLQQIKWLKTLVGT
jgi:hypothetical protein